MDPRIDRYSPFPAWVLLIFLSCNSPQEVASNSAGSPNQYDALSDHSIQPGATTSDGLTELFGRAIGEYIDTMFTAVKPDTLFIGRHAEFPAILLPAEIHGTKILVLTNEEAMAKLKYRKSLIYLNVMGWPDELSAEFLIVTFFDAAKPQHNLHLHFSRPTPTAEFKRDGLSFEYPYSNTIPLEQYLKN